MKKFLYTLALGAAIVIAFTSSQAHSKEKIRTVKVTLTKDNTISLRSAFYSETTGNLVHKARQLDARLKSKEPLFLVLDSPGGSISAGLNAIENLRNMNRPIHTINLFSASMGFETAQHLGKRLITVNGTLMSHKSWGVFWGEFPGQLDSRYQYWLKRSKRMAKQVVKRTEGKHTLKSYLALIENEYWCDGRDCIKQGFADYLVRPTCDKSLSGSYVEPVFQFIFFGHTIELKVQLPECPLNKGYLAYDIYIDGRPLYGNINSGNKHQETFVNERYDYASGGTVNVFSESQLIELKKKVQKALDTIDSRKVVVSP